jgi:CheY-like chemotaxis protein
MIPAVRGKNLMGTVQKKVLIVDDERVFREAMVDALTSCGYFCTAEDNPADGIMRLKTMQYDLVLLDIMMDPLDGWDTLDHIRNLSQGQNTPVIMVSAKALMVDEVIRYGDQVAGFLKKPFVASDFCEDIARFFSWYDPLISVASLAKSGGVPEFACDQWIRLSRQIQAFRRLKEIVSPWCMSDGSISEEECLAQKMKELDPIIEERVLARDVLQKQYVLLIL